MRGELADRQERHARELGEVRNGVLKDTQAQCADTHRSGEGLYLGTCVCTGVLQERVGCLEE